MAEPSRLGVLREIRRAASPLWLCSVVILGIGAVDAKAGFVGYYAPSNFTLTNTGGGFTTIDGVDVPTANGSAVFPNLLTLVLTGTMDGSYLPGATDFTIAALAAGNFEFTYLFTARSVDPANPDVPPVFADPHTQYGGFLVGSSLSCDPGTPDCNFFFLADEDGAPNASGSVSVPVKAGELIGFRVGGDNIGGIPGVLTITNFSAPIPEPGTFQLLLIAGIAAGVWARRSRTRRP